MLDRYALQLQLMPKAASQVLVIAGLIKDRKADTKFKPADIQAAFYELNVPPPANLHRVINSLVSQKLMLKHRDGYFALTPLGFEDISKSSLDQAAAYSNNNARDLKNGAVFAHTDHTTIPAWAAPPRWSTGIARLLERHPFDTNVFCMTRFPSEGPIPDPVTKAIKVARTELEKHGLTLHLATDAIVDDDLLGNVGAYMWACRYGLGIIENRIGRGMNYNTVIELGGMTLTGRRCTILKDSSASTLPTDLSGQIYRNVDLDNNKQVANAVSAWAKNDLNIPLIK